MKEQVVAGLAQQADKYLIFNYDIVSDDRLVKWLKDNKYKVISETDDYYKLEQQNGIDIAIEKALENKAYTVKELNK